MNNTVTHTSTCRKRKLFVLRITLFHFFICTSIFASNWSKQNINDGVIYSVNGVTVGNGRNDGNSRVYASNAADSTTHAKEYTWTGSSWSATSINDGFSYGVNGVAVGAGRGDSMDRVYASLSLAGTTHIKEYTWTGSSWSAANINDGISYSVNGVTVGEGRNDGVTRVYASYATASTTHIWEYTWTGSSWSSVQIGDGTSYSVNGVSVGTGRNDGIVRLYTSYDSANTTHVKEYTWTGSSWSATSINDGISYSVNGVAVGVGQDDGNSRVYASYGTASTTHVKEYTWTGSSWSATSINDGFSYGVNGVAVGAGRNDAKNRVYASYTLSDSLHGFEYTHSSGNAAPGNFTGDFSLSSGTVYNYTGDDRGYGVAVDTISGGGPYIYTVGVSSNGSNNDFLIIKYDSAGSKVASAVYDSGNDDEARSVAVDNSGNVFVAGTKYSPTNLWDFVILKYDSALTTILSSATYDAGDNDVAMDVAVDGAGDVFVAGYSYGTDYDIIIKKYSNNLGLLNSNSYDGFDANGDKGYSVAVNASGVYITGYKFVSAIPYGIVLKYSTDLTSLLASPTFSKGYEDSGYGVALDQTGNVFVGAYTGNGSNYDFSALKYDAALNLISSTTFNGGNNEECNDIAVDNNGNPVLCGYQVNLNKDYFWVQYNSALTAILSSATYNNATDDIAEAIAIDDSNYIYLAGESSNGSNFDVRAIRRTISGGSDTTPPAAVTDLAAATGTSEGEIDLSWTSPGDDGWSGNLTGKFRIDYATWTKSWVYTDYQVEISTSNCPPYANQRYKVTGLTAGETYYFRIWSADEVSNWSSVSNGTTAQVSYNNAVFVSQKVPSILVANSTFTVSITLQNTGLTTWTSENNFGLGSQNAQDNYLWLGSTNRVMLDGGDSIAPGQYKTFSFIITSTDTTGNYNFQWKMTGNGSGWFGESTENKIVYIYEPGTPSETIDTLDFFLTDYSSQALNGTHSVSQSTASNRSWYVKWSSSAFELHTWDSEYIYMREDRSYTDIYKFYPTGKWMKRSMDIGETIDETGNLARWFDAGNSPTNLNSWGYTTSLVAHATNFYMGGDLGYQDVIVLKYAHAGGNEFFFYSKDWGWCLWEQHTTTGTVLYNSTFNQISGTPISPAVSATENYAPGQVTGLTVAKDGVKVKLEWTTPGDDATMGVLFEGSEYRVQYSTQDPVSVNWSTATAQVIISTHGVLPGVTVSSSVALPEGATYYFRIWAKDDFANWSIGSSTALCYHSETDITAPGQVTGFTAATGTNEGEIDLTWTSPGDDGWSGNLTGQFRIDYATWTKTWTYTDYQVEISTSNCPSGTNQGYTVTGLTAGATYYFRLWSADEVPNWSSLSNGATAQAGFLSTNITEVSFNFGQIFPGGSAVSVSSAAVTNTGNINANYQIKLSTPPNWSAGTAPGADEFVFYVIFNSTQPSAGNFGAEDILSTATASCTGTVFAGDQTGANVPPGEKIGMWAYFKAPTATSVETQQAISVTITPAKP